MKKKGLIFFLLLPFLLGLLGVYVVSRNFAYIAKDIMGIDWDYASFESFKIDTDTLLKASALIDKNAELAYGNDLVFEVKGLDYKDTEIAAIEEKSDGYHLLTKEEGEVLVICHNEKGNVSRSFKALIYDKVAFAFYPSFPLSGSNIDPTLYVGRYDYKDERKVDASFSLSFLAAPTDLLNEMRLLSSSENISFDAEKRAIDIIGDGEAMLTLEVGREETYASYSLSFYIPEDSVNIYSYDELLLATNKSEKGERIVLRKSFESLSNSYYLAEDGSFIKKGGQYILKSDAAEPFGHYDPSSKKHSFSSEVYRFKTSSSLEYINEWNDFARKNGGKYKELSSTLVAGLRIQQDVYGNGFTINFHNLAFPYDKETYSDGSSRPVNNSDNLFQKRIYVYALGNPSDLPLIALYGQDNVGMYVDGDNIKINDVHIKNCDLPDSLSFLENVGTVVEVNGDNVSLTNCIMENGRNVLRSFSSFSLLVENCLLSHSLNFLADLGVNEFSKPNGWAKKSFLQPDGSSLNVSINQYMRENGEGDSLLNNYLNNGGAAGEYVKEALLSLSRNLYDSSANLESKGSTRFVDTYFYESGIASIGNETNFTGTFFYNNMPSYFTSLIEKYAKDLFPFLPSDIGGVSYPYEVSIEGDCRFYDYKSIDTMDLTGILEQNVDKLASSLLEGYSIKIDIDTIFPLKSILKQLAISSGNYIEEKDEEGNSKTIVNIPIAYYGGGENLAKVDISSSILESLSSPLDVDFLEYYLSLGGDAMGKLYRAITTFTGFEPFKFSLTDSSAPLYKEAPKIADLQEHAKGASI